MRFQESYREAIAVKLKTYPLALILFIFLSKTVWAQSNWLVGISGSYAYINDQFSTTLDYRAAPGTFLTGFREKIDDKGTVGGVFAGYQFLCRSWLWGIEASMDWQDFDHITPMTIVDIAGARAWQGTVHHERGTNVALSGRMGYAVSPYIMPFIRLGAETSRDQMETTFSGITVNTAAVTQTDRQRQYRLLAGFGFEIPFPTDFGLSARVEYNFHSQGKRLSTDVLVNDGTYNPSFDNGFFPKIHEFKVGLVWNFG